MKNKWFKVLLCMAIAVTVLVCTALAADPLTPADVVAGTGVACTVADDAVTGFTVTASSGIESGKEYALLVVKTDLDADTPAGLLEAVKNAETTPYAVGEGTILYIDQVTATASGVSFASFLPKSVSNSVVLLGGEFSDGTSPKLLGAIKGGAGSAVTGTVSSFNPTVDVVVELFKQGETKAAASGTIPGASIAPDDVDINEQEQVFTVEGVADGTYDVVISKTGHQSCTVTGVEVAGDVNIDDLLAAGDKMTLNCGDTDNDGEVGLFDLGNFAEVFLEEGANGEFYTDFDGDQVRTLDDLGILAANFLADPVVIDL